MMADKEYTMTQADIHLILQIVNQLARCPLFYDRSYENDRDDDVVYAPNNGDDWLPIGNEDAAGVGTITKQNTTQDVKPGETERNLKKLHLTNSNEDAVTDLEKDLKNPLSYNAIDHMMKTISKKYGITTKELHNRFVKKHGKIPDNWIKENFADGRGPGRPGDSKRAGIPKGATIAQLKKIRSSKTASPRKKQLAHWQINMRQGRKK
jgi:hypothetical protein